jgi:aldehyde:ferredoxin oxidoreductase
MYDAKTQKWSYAAGEGRILDREKFEEWKTKFYEFEGFSPASGQPTRKTLEAMNLKKVADVMQSKGKLG